MDIIHPAARDDDNLTTCSAGISSSWRQQSQRSSQKTSAASCENFSDSKTRRDLINCFNSNFCCMEEQCKLGLLDSGQHIYTDEGQCNNNKFLCARSPLPGLPHSPLTNPHSPQTNPRTTKHCNLGCDTGHELYNNKNTFVSKHSNKLTIINKMNSRRSSLTLLTADPAETASLLSQPPSANSPLSNSGTISGNSQLTALSCARQWDQGSSPSTLNDPQEVRKSRSYGSSLAGTFFNGYSFVLVLSCLLLVISPSAEACSSRSTPKPRPPSPTMRPNITFQTYACPPAYAAWYCLNGATCFTVKIGISILYNCECADGFMGQRCEFKDLDGSYLPTRERLKMALGQVREAATSVPVGLLIIVILVALAAFAFTKRRTTAKLRRIEAERSDYPEEDDQTSYQTADTSFSEASTQSPEYFWRETESPGRSSATTQTQSTITTVSSRPHSPLQSKQTSFLAMPNDKDNSSMEQIFSLESELSCSKMSRNNSCSSNDDICTVPATLVTSRVHQLTVQPLVVQPALANDLSMMAAGGDPESPQTPSSSVSGSVSFYLPSATSTPTTSITTSPSSPCIRESSLTPLSPSSSCSPTSWKSKRSPGSAGSSNGGARRNLGSCRSIRSAWMSEEEDCSKAVMASTLSYKLDTSI